MRWGEGEGTGGRASRCWSAVGGRAGCTTLFVVGSASTPCQILETNTNEPDVSGCRAETF